MSIQDSFLLDEVRCGFMIPSAIKQAWAAELEVLREIDRVCKKHNIQYFADWGTLLGTVRHGGFIPWDDDLDIVMKREDYNKFISLARFDMEEGFDVQTFRNHDDCWLFMGKVVGRNGFCFEKEHLRRFHNFPYIACVDVFVLDYVYKDPEKEEKRRNLCKYMLTVADVIGIEKQSPAKREPSLKMLEEMYGKKINRISDPVEMRRYLYGEVEKIFGEVPEKGSDTLTQIFPWGLIGKDFQFPKGYYEKAIELPFEDTVMPVPMMYDKMLRKRYGEYCRLVKSTGGHDYPFFEGQKKNLQKVLDFTLPEFRFERAKLHRSQEEDSCKDMSYKAMAKECLGELYRMKEELAEILGKMPEQEDGEKAVQSEQSLTSMERTIDLLQASQQLAIDFGNMMEQVLGEGCTLIRLLEQYCEALYGIYEQLLPEAKSDEAAEADNYPAVCKQSENYQQLNDILQAIEDELEQNVFNRGTVLFLPVLAKDWDSLHELWQECTADETCDVYVVPLPYYYKDYDGSPRNVCYEATEFPEEAGVLDYTILTPEYLEMLHPEVIVIQNPYDSWNPAISVPEMFYSENIRKYTDELIYVPPFAVEEYSKSNEREYSNMKYYVTMPGVVYADQVMVQSENMRKVYIEKLTEFAGDETKSVWERRVNVHSDVAAEDDAMMRKAECTGQEIVQTKVVQSNVSNRTGQKQKKRMLYGISLGAYLGDIEAAKGKIERNLRLFEEHKSRIDLTVWVFPDTVDADELRDYVDGKLKKCLGKRLEQGTECNPLDYDAYYGDAMPLVMKFRDIGKPVMVQDYCVE